MNHRNTLVAAIFLATAIAPGVTTAASSNETVLEALKASCEAGVLLDCNRVGTLFITARMGEGNPEGITRDLTEAVRYYEKACGRGDGMGCYQEGFVFQTSTGYLVGNEAKATELYRKACDGGYADGCDSLATMYEWGASGLPKDSAVAAGLQKKAAALFELACDRADAESCRRLANDYTTGLGVPINRELAEALFAKACRAGNAAACESQHNQR